MYWPKLQMPLVSSILKVDRMLLVNFVSAQSGFFLKMLISSNPGKSLAFDKKFIVIVR